MKLRTTLSLLLILGPLLAQKGPHQTGFPVPPQQHQWQNTSTGSIETALSWAQSHLLPSEAYSLVAAGQRNAHSATYYDFKIHYQGHPVYGLSVTARQFADGRIRWSYPVLPPQRAEGSFPPASQARQLVAQRGWQVRQTARPVWFIQDEQLVPAYALRAIGLRKAPLKVLATGDKVLWHRDERRFLGDSIVTGMVFYPDPLTTANVNYGGNYTDGADAEKSALNNERHSVSFQADYQGGTFYLRNSKILLSDFESPNVPVVTSATPQFNFTRGQDGFEDVNTFYHLSHFDAYIDSLGFPQIPGAQIEVDPHGAQGLDQSYFMPGSNRLALGPGGVDDAEDADVIIHEWTHAMAKYTAAPGNGSTERAMLEEALGDYYALSYSRHLNSNQDDKIFNWDGHNEFWFGRSAISTKNYQQLSFSGSIYAHTDLMVSCLREIHSQVGRQVSDKLVLESMFALTPSTTYQEFAFEMLRSDSLLFGEAHRQAIADAFIRRQVLPAWVGLAQQRPQADVEIYNTLGWMQGEALHLESSTGLHSIRLYALDGRPIYRQNLANAHSYRLHLPGLAAGAYLLEVRDHQGRMRHQKLLRR